MTPDVPNPADILYVGPAASVQFGGNRALVFRVISVDQVDPYNGWAWLTGYVLDRSGKATERREIYVLLSGLRVARSGRPGEQRRRLDPIPRQTRTGPLTESPSDRTSTSPVRRQTASQRFCAVIGKPHPGEPDPAQVAEWDQADAERAAHHAIDESAGW